jgi:hypothetical protein
MEKCKKCKHWKNQQAELEYSDFDGICTCYHWKFITTRNPDVKILDRSNLSSKRMGVHRFENQSEVIPVGRTEYSNYCFVTSEYFGCINFEKL